LRIQTKEQYFIMAKTITIYPKDILSSDHDDMFEWYGGKDSPQYREIVDMANGIRRCTNCHKIIDWDDTICSMCKIHPVCHAFTCTKNSCSCVSLIWSPSIRRYTDPRTSSLCSTHCSHCGNDPLYDVHDDPIIDNKLVNFNKKGKISPILNYDSGVGGREGCIYSLIVKTASWTQAQILVKKYPTYKSIKNSLTKKYCRCDGCDVRDAVVWESAIRLQCRYYGEFYEFTKIQTCKKCAYQKRFSTENICTILGDDIDDDVLDIISSQHAFYKKNGYSNTIIEFVNEKCADIFMSVYSPYRYYV